MPRIASDYSSLRQRVAYLLRLRAPQFTLVAEGCAYGWWRGPWGQCRDTAFFGHMPDGSNTYRPDCPQVYWVGPWGNCRDTPYHGRLPGGDYR